MQTLAQLADVTDPMFRLTDRHAVYARMRAEQPVYWHEKGQCWLITKYEDVKYVAGNPQIYSAAQGLGMGDNLHPERDAARVPPGCENLLGTDPPRHLQLRRLVSAGFTPRSLAQLEGFIREITAEALDRIPRGTEIDFVKDVSDPIPTRAIMHLLGIDDADMAAVQRWSDAEFKTLDIGPGEPGWDEIAAELMEMWGYFAGVLEERRRHPQDDLVTRLAQVEIDGERLADGTTVMFCMSLLSAGNHTTRSMLGGGTLALAESDGAYQHLVRDRTLIPNAVGEILRWVTPIASFCRTALVDDEISGVPIRAGDYIVQLYESANRDEDVWASAGVFDVTRPTNPSHLAFGWGEHICIGAHLARMEGTAFLDEMTKRFTRVTLAAEPTQVPSTAFNALSHLPIVVE